MPSRPTMLGSLSLAIGFAVISTASPAEAHDDQAVPRNAPAGSRAGTNAEGFDGQIEVPAPFTRGSAFLLMGDDDCGVLHRHWLRMAQDTRDPEESASGIDTPGLPIACAKSKGVVTCKIFKDGFTAAFTAPITADTPAEFRFRTPAGYIDAAINLSMRTATLTQTAYGRSTVCLVKYKAREDAVDDVARLDPAERALPSKNRPNGMESGGDRLKCKSRNDSRGPADPLTGRRPAVCSACTDRCRFAGDECIGGACVYTGKGRSVVFAPPSTSGPAMGSARGGGKRRGKGLGQSCKSTSECEEGRVCSQRTPRLRTCQ